MQWFYRLQNPCHLSTQEALLLRHFVWRFVISPQVQYSPNLVATRRVCWRCIFGVSRVASYTPKHLSDIPWQAISWRHLVWGSITCLLNSNIQQTWGHPKENSAGDLWWFWSFKNSGVALCTPEPMTEILAEKYFLGHFVCISPFGGP